MDFFTKKMKKTKSAQNVVIGGKNAKFSISGKKCFFEIIALIHAIYEVMVVGPNKTDSRVFLRLTDGACTTK